MKPQYLLLLIFVLLVGVVVIGSQRTSSQSRRDIEIIGLVQNVSYNGVTFSFDRSLAEGVTPLTIPASTDGKPSDIWPDHVGFSLNGYPRPRSSAPEDPHIRVFSISKFREALATATTEYKKSVAQPSKVEDWTKYLDTEVGLLKSLLKTQPQGANLRAFLARSRGKEGCGATMPFVPLWEACQAFVARARYVKFKSGEGVLFLTQQNVSEVSQATNQGLEYAFQGITNDGQSYVYAEFSVNAPFLPKGDEPAVEAWNQKNYLLSHRSAQYQKYVRPIIVKLEQLRPDQFKPDLTRLETLISSIEVQPK